MLKDVDTKKIDDIIKQYFNIIYDYKFDGIVLLWGGAIRDTIMGNKIKDLDFVILSQKKCQIKNFIKENNLKYKINALGGYKIFYKNMTIDMFTTDDLLDGANYDTDLLFYDIEEHLLIPCGAIHSYNTRTITEVNNTKKWLYGNKNRLKKLKKFIKYITKSDKRVKVKQNNINLFYRKIKRKATKIKNSFKNGNFRKCFIFLEGCKKEFKLIILMGILISFISAIIPSLSGNLVVKILDRGFRPILVIIAIIILLKLISIILSFYFSKLYLKIKKKMVFNIRKSISETVINFDVKNFNNSSSGFFINRIKDDPNEIATSFNKIKDILIGGIGNFGIIIYICYLNWILGIILIVFMFIIYKVKMIGIRERLKAKREVLEEQEKYATMLNEMISGINDIKALDLKSNYISKTVKSFEDVSDIEFYGDYKENIYDKVSKLLEFITMGIILLVGVFLIKKEMLIPSSLVIILMYKANVFSFLNRLTTLMNVRLEFNLSCSRIFSLLDGNQFTKESYGNRSIKNCKGIIEFKNVSFKYSSNYVLDNCSFKTDKYDTVAIVGESGAGKTTILNLITKAYVPEKGKILIDNIDINDLSEECIRNNISIISQNPYFFDMSIIDNFRLMNENITIQEIKDICKKVCLDDFIESLPNGYDTFVGEGGFKLSQGQKQRLGIARALAKNTKIILLDEITSALDSGNEKNIQKIIDNIKNDHTIIMVTHNLSMVKGFKVFELKDGKVNYIEI